MKIFPKNVLFTSVCICSSGSENAFLGEDFVLSLRRFCKDLVAEACRERMTWVIYLHRRDL